MTKLTETTQWEDDIYQIRTTDPLLGGPDGISNLQAEQLANRTCFLKNKQENHEQAENPHTQYVLKSVLDHTLEEHVNSDDPHLPYSAFPKNAEDGQSVIFRDGKWGLELVSDIPIGTMAYVPQNTPGYIDLAYDNNHSILVSDYPKLAAARYCGDDNNATAGWFYCCDNADGSERNVNGAYFILPGLRQYFLRCGVPDWKRHQDQIQNIVGEFDAGNAGLVGDRTGAFQSGVSKPNYLTGAVGASTAIAFDASRVARTGEETTPKFVYENIAIKAYAIATNHEQIDMSYVINKLQQLDADKLSHSDANEYVVGDIKMWPSAKLPSDRKWMVRKGDILAIEDYPELFALIGKTFGGNGVTTFALPDDRGLVERGIDLGRGYDPGRVLGTEQEDAIRDIVGGMAGSHYVRTGGCYGAVANNPYQGFQDNSGTLHLGINSGFVFKASNVVPTAEENRVRNRAYLPIIKVLP